jgi:hypothetical protein
MPLNTCAAAIFRPACTSVLVSENFCAAAELAEAAVKAAATSMALGNRRDMSMTGSPGMIVRFHVEVSVVRRLMNRARSPNVPSLSPLAS